MVVVADTTPLITLLKINKFDILNKLYGTVHIPKAVYDELTTNTDFSHELEIVRNTTFLEIHSDIPADRVDLLRRATGLDLGESEAIVLADLSETKTLLMDESHGRAVAAQMKIPITGVIGVLIAAYKKELLTAEEITNCVQIMKLSNRFISERLYNLLFSMLK
ncbi:MAG: DUF3368 domain-containing protein [Treponemataceae bacterium]|nr:DUF3368 domain-containing protein [Treponemataceae bacterium]